MQRLSAYSETRLKRLHFKAKTLFPNKRLVDTDQYDVVNALRVRRKMSVGRSCVEP